MKNKPKQFAPYDRVLVRDIDDGTWKPSFYQFFNEEREQHAVMLMDYWLDDFEILPYEGNEHLVGTTDEPDEEVKLKNGEYIMVADEPYISEYKWQLRRFVGTHDFTACFIVRALDNMLFRWKYAIRFKDFNPDDMEETKKHILCVKNGKIIKYKE